MAIPYKESSRRWEDCNFCSLIVFHLPFLCVAVHRGVMMADTLSFNAKIGVVNF